jgi:hypothetical protein
MAASMSPLQMPGSSADMDGIFDCQGRQTLAEILRVNLIGPG